MNDAVHASRLKPFGSELVLETLQVGHVEQPQRDLAESLLADPSLQDMARDRFVILYPVRSDAVRLLFDPALELGFDCHVRRGELFSRPEKASLVALGEVLNVIEGLILDLTGDDQSGRFEKAAVFPCVGKAGSFPAPHSVPEKPESEESMAVDLDDTAHNSTWAFSCGALRQFERRGIDCHRRCRFLCRLSVHRA